MRGALAAAHDRGNAICKIRLMSGETFQFEIHNIVEDALIGTRISTPHVAALVPYHAIAMIEFLG
jgi:hypothetical protein